MNEPTKALSYNVIEAFKQQRKVSTVDIVQFIYLMWGNLIANAYHCFDHWRVYNPFLRRLEKYDNLYLTGFSHRNVPSAVYRKKTWIHLLSSIETVIDP